jgi:hypothetical protein
MIRQRVAKGRIKGSSCDWRAIRETGWEEPRVGGG